MHYFRQKVSQARRWVVTLLILSFILPPSPTWGQIGIDPTTPDDRRPGQDYAQNGVPVVNITAPSAAGVSKNDFTEYNVNPDGVIINNSREIDRSELGGLINANPNLHNQDDAQIVVFEVTGQTRSSLEGVTEMHGRSAEFILANPNGIYVNGAGFINIPRAALTTGKMIYGPNGEVTGIEIRKGQIEVGVNGLNAGNLDHFELLSRALKADGSIWGGKELKVVVGQNDYDYRTKQHTARSDGSDKPEWGIDAGALSGMYAGKITLISTEAGVGVRSAAEMAADIGDITLKANGQIVVRDIRTNATYRADGEGVTQEGNIQANQVAIVSGQQLTIQGAAVQAQQIMLSADGHLSMSDATIVAPDMQMASGESTEIRRTEITAQTAEVQSQKDVQLRDSVVRSETITVEADGTLSNDGVVVANEAEITVGSLNNDGGAIGVNEYFKITAQNNVSNRAGLIESVSATGVASQILAQSIDNTDGEMLVNSIFSLGANEFQNNGGFIASDGPLTIVADALDNTAGSIQSNADLEVNGGAIQNTSGQIIANGAVEVEGDRLDNTQGVVASIGDEADKLALTVGEITNTEGTLVSDGKIEIGATGLTNDKGIIQAEGDLEIDTDTVANTNSDAGQGISAGKVLKVTSQELDNTNGVMIANDHFELAITDTLTNQDGHIESLGINGIASHILAQTVDNTGGAVLVNSVFTLTAEDVQNSSGLIATEGQLTVEADTLDNRAGIIQTNADLDINGGTIQNTSGEIVANGTVEITGDTLDNTQGTIASIGESSDWLYLDAGTITNTDGTILSEGQLGIAATELGNDKGVIQSDGDLDIAAARVTNTNSGAGQGIGSGGQLTVESDELDNANGTILSGDQVELTISGTLTNENGHIESIGLNGIASHILAQTIDNTNGTVLANSVFTLSAEDVQNQGGLIGSEGQLIVETGTLDNSAGIVQANANLEVEASAIQNTSGQFIANGSIKVAGNTLDNTNGVVAASNHFELNITNELTNDNGYIESVGLSGIASQLLAKTVDNTNGIILVNSVLNLTADTIQNNDGVMVAEDPLTIGVKTLNNTRGVLQANDSLEVTGEAINNANGTVIANGDLILAGQTIDNTQGVIASVGADKAINLTATTITNTQGTIESNGDVAIQAPTVTNTNSDPGQGIGSGGQLTIESETLDNQNGRLIANQDVQLTVSDFLNNVSGIIEAMGLSGAASNLSAAQLNNTDGLIRINGDANLSGSQLTNTNGQVLAQNLNSTYQSITNQDGLLYAENRLTARNVDNTNGTIEAGGELNLTIEQGAFNNVGGVVALFGAGQARIQSAAGVHNQGGELISAGDLVLDFEPYDFVANGTIEAGGRLALTAHSLTNSGTLLGQTAVELTIQQDILNTGTIASNGNLDITLTAGQLQNQSTGRLRSGGAMTLTMQGLVNEGIVESMGALNLNSTGADTVNNARLLSLGAMTITQRQGEVQNTGLIFSGGDLHIDTEEGLNNSDADIYAVGNLTIDYAGGRTAVVDNYEAEIASEGDIVIRADEIRNHRREPVRVNGAGDADHPGLTLWYDDPSYWTGAVDWSYAFNEYYMPTWERQNLIRNHLVENGYDYRWITGKLDQYYGNWYNHDFLRSLVDYWTERGKPIYEALRLAGASRPGYFYKDDNPLPENDPLIQPVTALVYEDQWSGGRRGTIGSLGDMVIDSSAIRNVGSTLSSGGDLHIDVDTVENLGFEVGELSYHHRWESWQTQKSSGFLGLGDEKARYHYQFATDVISNTTVHPSLISAGGNLTGTIHSSVINATTHSEIQSNTSSQGFEGRLEVVDVAGVGQATIQKVGQLAIGSNHQTRAQLTTQSGGQRQFDATLTQAKSTKTVAGTAQLNTVQSGQNRVDVPDDIIAGGVAKTKASRTGQIDAGQYAVLPDDTTGLFKLNTPDDSPLSSGDGVEVAAPALQYLVETNVEYLDMDQFLGSEYFLDRIGFDQDAILLGDALYETRLLRDAIIQETGRRYLSEAYASDFDQLKALYDNAYTAHQELNLTVGTALTQAQIDQLTSDMIWLVEEDVNGVSVLVPKVYLTTATRENVQYITGGTMEGDIVSLESGGTVFNTGDIIGRTALIINSDGTVTNRGGRLTSGEMTAVTSRTGDILNDTEVFNTRFNNNTQDRSGIGRRAEISSKGGLLLDANGNLVSNAGTLRSGGTMVLSAGQDIQLGAKERRDRYELIRKNYHERETATRFETSDISAGGDMQLTAGRDITSEGADITAEGIGIIQAGRNIQAGTVHNTETYYKHTKFKSSGLFSKTRITTLDTSMTDTVKGTAFNLKNGARFETGNDLNLVGSTIDTEGHLELDVGNDLNLLVDYNAKDSHSEYHKKTGLMLFGWDTGIELSGRDKIDKMPELDAVGSQINVGGSMALTTGQDFMVQGSDITVEGTAENWKVGGDTTILTAVENREEYHLDEKRSFSGISLDFTRSSVGVGFNQKGKRSETHTKTVSHQGSQIMVKGGNLGLESDGKTLISGSDIIAAGDIAIESQNGTTITAVNESVDHSDTLTTIKNKISLTLGNQWVETTHQMKDAANTAKDAFSNPAPGGTEDTVNKAAASAKAALAVAQSAKLAADVAASAETAGTLGFYLSLDVTRKEKSSTTETQSETAKASTLIAGGDITLDSGEQELSIIGSDISAGKDITLASNADIYIQGKETKTDERHRTRETTIKKTLASTSGFKMAGDSALPTYSKDKLNDRTTHTQQRHSNITALDGKLTIKSKDDLTFQDAQGLAKEVDVQVGGTAKIASSQDETVGKTDGHQFSVGNTMGYGQTDGYVDKKWVGQQTKLIGSEKVELNANKLELEGAVIANQEIAQTQVETETGESVTTLELGEDKGNLKVAVNELAVADIQDRDDQWRESFSVNSNLKNQFNAGKGFTADPNSGSTHVVASNGGREQERTTKSVIGDGEVLVRGDAADIAADNRDVGATQVMVKDRSKGGLGVDISIENRAFEDPVAYIEDMAGDILGLPKNVEQAVNRVGDAASDLVSSAGKGGLNLFDTADRYVDRTARREALAQMMPDELKVIANPEEYSETQKKAVADKYSQVYAGIRGIDAAESNFFDDEQLDAETAVDSKGIDKRNAIAFTDGDANQDDIYYEADQINKGDNFAHALGHENKRQDQIEKGIVNNTPDGVSTRYDQDAREAGAHNVSALERELGYKNVKDNGGGEVSYVRSGADEALIRDGTTKADGVRDVQPLGIYTPGTDMFGKGQTYDQDLVRSMAEIKGKIPVIIEWGAPDGSNRLNGKELAKQLEGLNLTDEQELIIINFWGGANDANARKRAGEQLAEFIDQYNFRDGEGLDNVGHSHGGNVIKEFTQSYEGDKKLDTTVFLGTPHRPDHQYDWSDTDKDSRTINLYDTGDGVQIRGGKDPIGPANRELNGATNVPIYQTRGVNLEIGGTDPDDVFPVMTINQDVHIGPFDSHTNLDSGDVWEQYVQPKLPIPKPN